MWTKYDLDYYANFHLRTHYQESIFRSFQKNGPFNSRMLISFDLYSQTNKYSQFKIKAVKFKVCQSGQELLEVAQRVIPYFYRVYPRPL